MNEWEKIVLPLKGKQEIQKRSPGTFHVEARRQDEATVISGEYCFEGDRAFFFRTFENVPGNTGGANPTGAGVDRTY